MKKFHHCLKTLQYIFFHPFLLSIFLTMSGTACPKKTCEKPTRLCFFFLSRVFNHVSKQQDIPHNAVYYGHLQHHHSPHRSTQHVNTARGQDPAQSMYHSMSLSTAIHNNTLPCRPNLLDSNHRYIFYQKNIYCQGT